MNIKDLCQLKAETGWGLRDCKAALSEHGGLEETLNYYRQGRSMIHHSSEAYKAALSSAPMQDWWIRDFLSRSATELASHKDPLLKDWGKARADFDSFKTNRLHPSTDSYASFKGALEWANATDKKEASALGIGTWKDASSTHIVPVFEEGWLAALKEDPFQELRPLQRTGVAESVLQRQAVFELPATSDRAKYIAETLFQAEQYYTASQAVGLETKPLLLYYMTTALARAALTIRTESFIGRHGSHGLKTDSIGTGLSGQQIIPTQSGLFQALLNGLPGSAPHPLSGPWTLSTLCMLIPELSESLNTYTQDSSNCQRILNFSEHSQIGIGLSYLYHLTLVLPDSFLRKCGVTDRSNEGALRSQLRTAFPGSFWSLGLDRDVSTTHSDLLGEAIIGAHHCASSKDWQRRVYPLIHQGGLDGEWYVVYNSNSKPPHQLTVFYAALYALSMLVRYKPVVWSEMLSAPDTTRAIIDRLCRIAAQKIPILASEIILGKRILGSLARIPR
jgi:hypothetical protein